MTARWPGWAVVFAGWLAWLATPVIGAIAGHPGEALRSTPTVAAYLATGTVLFARQPRNPVTRGFGPDIEGAAYFFVCEALGNVLKHAGATRAVVRLQAHAGRLTVEVRDDGRGFAVQPAAQSGLRGLRDRIEALGGRMDIASAAGQGTSISAWLPTGEAAHF